MFKYIFTACLAYLMVNSHSRSLLRSLLFSLFGALPRRLCKEIIISMDDPNLQRSNRKNNETLHTFCSILITTTVRVCNK